MGFKGCFRVISGCIVSKGFRCLRVGLHNLNKSSNKFSIGFKLYVRGKTYV